jgi:hypothetical protein
MENVLSYSIAKLTSNTNTERALYSGILEHDLDPSYGQMIYIIDIPLPPVVSEPIVTEIISTINEEYFGVERKTAIYQFEDCIKQTNAALSFIAEQGNNEWIGHIHALVALIVGDEIYISNSGRATAAVIRGSLYTPIISSVQNPNQRVLAHKTFANLVSGQLSENDFLIFGNSEVSRHFSPQFLSQAAIESPISTIQSMYQAGRRLNLRNIAVIVAKLEQEDIGVPTSPYSITLDQPLDVANSSLIPKVPSAKNYNSIFIHQSLKFVTNFLWRAIKTGIRLIKSTFEKQHTNLEFQKTEGDIEVKSYHHSNHTLLKRTPGQRLVNNFEHWHGTLNKYIQVFRTFMKNLSPRYLITIGIIIVAILTLTIAQRITKQDVGTVTGAEATEQINQITALFTETVAVKTDNPEKARSNLSQINTILSKLANNNDQKVKDAQNQYLALVSEVNNITNVDDKNKISVAKDTNNIFAIGQYLFTTKQNSSDIFRSTLGKNEPADKIFSTPDNAAITLVSLNEPTRILTILTKSNHLYTYSLDDQTTNSILSPPQGESWPKIESLTWYQKNLYILENGTGAIYKYTSTDGIKFSSKTPYLASESFSRPDAKSISTDGSMYLLFGSGSVSKIVKGNKQSYGPLELPLPDNNWDNPIALFTGTTTGHLYIQDKSRIIVTNQDGTYRSQYKFTYGNIDNCYISPISKRGWILSGEVVYQFSL